MAKLRRQVNPIRRKAIGTLVEPIFYVDNYGWVIAEQPDKGKLKSQSVEANLLFAILRLLEKDRRFQKPRR